MCETRIKKAISQQYLCDLKHLEDVFNEKPAKDELINTRASRKRFLIIIINTIDERDQMHRR